MQTTRHYLGSACMGLNNFGTETCVTLFESKTPYPGGNSRPAPVKRSRSGFWSVRSFSRSPPSPVTGLMRTFNCQSAPIPPHH